MARVWYEVDNSSSMKESNFVMVVVKFDRRLVVLCGVWRISENMVRSLLSYGQELACV